LLMASRDHPESFDTTVGGGVVLLRDMHLTTRNVLKISFS